MRFRVFVGFFGSSVVIVFVVFFFICIIIVCGFLVFGRVCDRSFVGVVRWGLVLGFGIGFDLRLIFWVVFM